MQRLNTNDKMLRELEKRILLMISRNPRITDSEVARKLDTSQPTVTRTRQSLEEAGLLRYANHPKLGEIGCELLVFTVFKARGYSEKGLIASAQKWIRNHPKVLFSAPGEGLGGRTEIVISVHKTFAEYEEFTREIRAKWEDKFEDIDQFFTSIKKTIKDFDYSSILNANI